MLYLLIVNYYSTELIQTLLESIPGEDLAKIGVIIINNSPDDRTLSSLTPDYPNLTLLSPSENLGFGGGCNLGLNWVYDRDRNARVWLINPDTTLSDRAITYIQSCFRAYPNLGILGTQIQDSEGNLWFSQGRFNRWLGSLPHQSLSDRITIAANQTPNSLISPAIIPSRWVSGCSLIINFNQFNHCPQFDRHYFLYYEDNDLCERYFQQGYAIAVTQAILVTHQISATSDRNLQAKFHHATYSKLYFLQSHATNLALILNLGYIGLKIIASLAHQDFPTALGRWQGIQQFLGISDKSEVE